MTSKKGNQKGGLKGAATGARPANQDRRQPDELKKAGQKSNKPASGKS